MSGAAMPACIAAPPLCHFEPPPAPEGSCEQAVPHASVSRARYCTAERRRLRKTRKRSPVKMVFIWERSWKVVGSTACRMKKMQLLLMK